MSSIFALHSGSFFGLPGVIALAIASALMPLFAITGWMLYLRRRSPAPILPARPARTPQRVGALAALAVHALAGVALLSHEPARSALIAAAPIMVDLIAPPKAEPKPAPPVEIVPPKPSRKPPAQPKAPAPLVTAAAEAPSPSIAPSPAPQQPPPEPQPAPIVAAPPAAAPVPVTPPVFSAQYLANPSPAYPALSRRRGEHGRVILRVLVSIEGKAEEVQVRTSSGHPRLDEVARNTVQSWRFVPARRGDQPIAAWALVPISFRLEG